MGLYLRKTLDNKAEISVWQITETEQELIDLSSVPTDEMEEISLIRSETLRKQKLAVRALLNTVFEEKMYLNHHDNGKPFLENCITNISITHTDRYVAIITHDEDDVGIDIESLDRDFSAVGKKVLSEEDFHRLKTPLLTTKATGLGLGVTIASALAEANGGQIQFQARPEGGLIAAVTLPCAVSPLKTDSVTPNNHPKEH